MVHARKDLSSLTREAVLKQRGYLESYIREFPEFLTTHNAWSQGQPGPAIVEDMIAAGQQSDVGPMAAVAGAIAEHVGKELLSYSSEIVVENGGDVFVCIKHPVTVGVYAGRSPLSMRLGIRIHPADTPMGICTSSGTIGHSISHGHSDAVVVTALSCAAADAAATAIGNRVKNRHDINVAIDFGKQIQGIQGILVIIGAEMGAWGQLELVPLKSAQV